MQYLLDTHTFLWFLEGDNQLSNKVKNEITDIKNTYFISIASLWEIAIKSSLGKLNLKFPFDNLTSYLSTNDIEIIPITFDHIQTLRNLELHHRDPFDRLLIAQAIKENLIILTRDSNFFKYTVQIVWG
jgi:PIN domain nuclease of toxin-antitoxin system